MDTYIIGIYAISSSMVVGYLLVYELKAHMLAFLHSHASIIGWFGKQFYMTLNMCRRHPN